jgi:hypothetical protein
MGSFWGMIKTISKLSTKSPKPFKMLYNVYMKQTKETLPFLTKSGKIYQYSIEPRSRVDYREFMNPDTKYTLSYFQINVFNDEGKFVNFRLVDDADDLTARSAAINEVVEWESTPKEILKSMNSRFD